MKKIIVMMLIVFLSGNISAFAENEIVIKVNGNIIETDQPPILINGRTMVPVRAISEALGAQVSWNELYKAVEINVADSKRLQLRIDSWEYKINGVRAITDVSPVVENNRTLVPVRIVAEALSCNVAWDEQTQTVSVDSVEPTNLAQYDILKADLNQPLVCNAYERTLTDGDYSYVFRIPQINIKDEAAQLLSKKIYTDLISKIQNVVNAYYSGDGVPVPGSDYLYAVRNGIISIVTARHTAGSASYYRTYNYDINAKKEISADEIISRCNASMPEYIQSVREKCVPAFDICFPPNSSYIDNIDVYNMERAAANEDQCFSADSPAFFTDNGTVYAIVKLPSIIGASYYEYMISSGLVLPK